MRANAEAPAEPLVGAAATASDEPANLRSAARHAYRDAQRDGQVLTGADLGTRFGMSERWGRARVAEVRRGTDRAASVTRADADGNDVPQGRPNGKSGQAGHRHVASQTTGNGNGTTQGGKRNGTPTAVGNGRVTSARLAEEIPVERLAADNEPSAGLDRMMTVAVIIVACVAAAASYEHQRAVAELAGEGWRAWILPLSVDGLLTAATRQMLARRRANQPADALTWVSLALGVAASVGANIVGADPSLADPVVVGRVVAAWPPVALFLSLEILMRRSGPHGEGHER